MPTPQHVSAVNGIKAIAVTVADKIKSMVASVSGKREEEEIFLIEETSLSFFKNIPLHPDADRLAEVADKMAQDFEKNNALAAYDINVTHRHLIEQ
ncbi:MAG: hypothetical protein Q7U57_01760 [Methylovulum sp.]|nr:hypothetical protein [Methylovulum sp.]